MLRQELSLGYVHTTQTMTNKMQTPDDECGWQIGKQTCMLSAMVIMVLVKGTKKSNFEKLGNFKSVNTWRACITFRNFLISLCNLNQILKVCKYMDRKDMKYCGSE